MIPGSLLVLGGRVSFLAAVRERHAIVMPAVNSALVKRVAVTLLAVIGMTQLSTQGFGVISGVILIVKSLI